MVAMGNMIDNHASPTACTLRFGWLSTIIPWLPYINYNLYPVAMLLLSKIYAILH